ncbi:MAG: ROK family protein [Sideroxydans sp.]|nr:ROK family protein [Sideroxydans sp.]
MNDAALRIGVDVGGTNLRVGVVQQRRILWEHRHNADFSQICCGHTPALALEKIIAELDVAIEQARKKYPAVESVGIGFPGFIDPQTRSVALSPNLPGLKNVDIALPLARRIGLPVSIENDALAAAFGEYLMADPQPASLLYLGLGTGVGGGLILDGKPYPGQHGVAMEAGHLIVKPGGRPCGCGNNGCLEQYASASGVAITYRQLTNATLNAQQIAMLAEQGNRDALEAFQVAAEMLGIALAHMLKVVDVEQVVIGGGMNAAWPLMQSAFDASLQDALIPALRGRTLVTLAKAGDQAGMLGAACLPA